MHRKADGHPLERRGGDGGSLRCSGRAAVRGEAEPLQQHPAAGETPATGGAIRAPGDGGRECILAAAAELLRPGQLARHLGI